MSRRVKAQGAKLGMEIIRQLDKSDMLGLLLDFPWQLESAQKIAKLARISFKGGLGRFNKIVFVGLGGSGIGADLVRSYLYFEIKVPVITLREYELPAYVCKDTLVFVCSYSGNTEEALSAYAQARQKGARIIVISSGGKLGERAKADNTVFVQVPQGLPPRCALGYLGIVPLCILSRLGLIKDVSAPISRTVKLLEALNRNVLSPSVRQKDNLAKSIAFRLLDKFPVVYSSSVHFDVCATRLRSQLNENSKVLASSHVFPEMNHNEIVGWHHPRKLFKDFVVLMLRDKGMHPRVKKRMDITSAILKKEGIEVLEIWSRGKDLLSRILSLMYIGDFISYYLAVLYVINPTPVDRITYLKAALTKK